MRIVLLALLVVAPTAQTTIDGLAAVVAGDPIFLSDVWNTERRQLLDPSGSLAALREGRADDAEGQVLERLIDRRLVLGEIARYAPIRPPQPEIDAAVARWRARASARGVETSAADPVALAFIADTLRIERYIEQRFTAAAHPTREEARTYYLADPESFARDGATPSFDDVEDDARARLGEERRLAMVRDWLEGLRSRAQVRVIDRGGYVGTWLGWARWTVEEWGRGIGDPVRPPSANPTHRSY